MCATLDTCQQGLILWFTFEGLICQTIVYLASCILRQELYPNILADFSLFHNLNNTILLALLPLHSFSDHFDRFNDPLLADIKCNDLCIVPSSLMPIPIKHFKILHLAFTIGTLMSSLPSWSSWSSLSHKLHIFGNFLRIFWKRHMPITYESQKPH